MKRILSPLFMLIILISCTGRHACLVKSQKTGLIQTNCYLVYDKISREAALIDPGDTIPTLLRIMEEEQLDVKYIFFTHAHPDHIKGVKYIREKYPTARICFNPVEFNDMQEYSLWRMIFDSSYVKSWSSLPPMIQLMDFDFKETGPPEIECSDQKVLRLGKMKLKILETPGHSRGSISIAAEDNLFTGDLILFGETGTINYKFNSKEDIFQSIQMIYRNFSDSTVIYPGHGKKTTVGEEKRTNKSVPGGRNIAQIAYRIPEKDLIAEGITYSSSIGSFYIGSIYKGKITRINAGNGTVKDFIPSGMLGLQVLGMTVDEPSGILWACANGEKNGREISAIVRFDLNTGEQLSLWSRISCSA